MLATIPFFIPILAGISATLLVLAGYGVGQRDGQRRATQERIRERLARV